MDFAFASPVFVNKPLYPVLKRLLGTKVGKGRECAWCCEWTRNGKAFAGKDDTCNVVHTACVKDLSQTVPYVFINVAFSFSLPFPLTLREGDRQDKHSSVLRILLNAKSAGNKDELHLF